ncbi:MAG: hypothetical protein JXM70_08755 [Pirellulales bacterium]|nr:hypothetical protein [Pirellulales bacterium]
MFRAMALKEFREIRGVALAAMIIYGIITIAAIDYRSPLNLFLYLPINWREGIPFVYDSFVGKFYFFAALMAIILGLWQTFGESVRGTYPFLLHRPASTSWLMGMKLLVGTVVYLVASAIPLLIYGIWAATPGNHASPFEWSMTEPVWVSWSAMTIVYLGAFLTGIMPGRWYHARFLPLAASILVMVGVAVLANYVFAGALWLCWIILAVDIWIIILIVFIAKSRDYT